MPELPEVETVKNSLKLRLIGKKIYKVVVRYPNIIAYPSVDDFIKGVGGKEIRDIKRRGKFLMFDLGDSYLLSHLRMEGKYFFKKHDEEINKHEHVIFDLGDMELRYMDTRKFGRMYLIKKDMVNDMKPISELGLEPWDEGLTVSYLKDKYKNKKLPIKSVILDQSIIVGIGNIYADEVLFASKIYPLKRGNEITMEECEKIKESSKKIITEAIKYGGTTIKSYTSSLGVTGRFQQFLMVHKRENAECFICHAKIKRIKVGGRSTYYCPNCQK